MAQRSSRSLRLAPSLDPGGWPRYFTRSSGSDAGGEAVETTPVNPPGGLGGGIQILMSVRKVTKFCLWRGSVPCVVHKTVCLHQWFPLKGYGPSSRSTAASQQANSGRCGGCFQLLRGCTQTVTHLSFLCVYCSLMRRLKRFNMSCQTHPKPWGAAGVMQDFLLLLSYEKNLMFWKNMQVEYFKFNSF